MKQRKRIKVKVLNLVDDKLKGIDYIGDLLTEEENKRLACDEEGFREAIKLSAEDPVFYASSSYSGGTVICNSKGCLRLAVHLKLGSKVKLSKPVETN